MWQPHIIHWEAENTCLRGKKNGIISALKTKTCHLSDKLVSWLNFFHEDTWLFIQQFAFWCSLIPIQVKMEGFKSNCSVVAKLAKISEENDSVGNLQKGQGGRKTLLLILIFFFQSSLGSKTVRTWTEMTRRGVTYLKEHCLTDFFRTSLYTFYHEM